MIRQKGYPVEVHVVQTADGYGLEMHRIPHGKMSNISDKPRPVAYLQHGLLCSSADWVMGAADDSLGIVKLRLNFKHKLLYA